METTPAAGSEPPVPEAPPSPFGPPPRWHPLARAALYLAAYVVVQIAAVLALSLPSFLLDEGWFRRGGLASSNEIFLLAIVLAAPPTVGMTLLFVRLLDRRMPASLGARWPRGGRRAALRQLLTVPAATLAFLGGWLALLLALPSSLATVRGGGVSAGFAAGPAWWPFSPALLLGVLLLGFLVQGGLEEWVVRGYVYHALKERWRPWSAAVVSSLVFALLHAANPGISAIALLNIVLAGLVLAALVERSGSLWSATLAHGVWNFAVACLLSLPISGVGIFHLLDLSVRGDAGLTGGSFGPEGSLLLSLLGLPLAAALWWRIFRAARLRPETGPSTLEDGPQRDSL